MAKKPVQFLTVPAELQPIAHACRQYLLNNGLKLILEHKEHHFPETATIYGKHKKEQHFYIFDPHLKKDRLTLWAGYGKSCPHGSFVSLCAPSDAIGANDLVFMQNLGLGLLVLRDDGGVAELLQPVDLSLRVALPPLDRHRPAVKVELSKVHSLFGRGDWKRGFEEACKVVEKNARTYLRRQAKANNVIVPSKKGKTKKLSVGEIDRMPLGALAKVFCNKMTPTPIDNQLCTGLEIINPDRINVAHHILTAKKEAQLRANVGRHMWTIDNLLISIPP
ncbi:MAG: hypothetical protein K2P94_09770 [Rhodospirillaceae bacterium]|nr:hypothetical protein [Rhodospirillaceae bacterium]